MRIDDREALAGFYVLHDQIADERRFSGAGLPDDIKMAPTILVGHKNRFHLAAEMAFAELEPLLRQVFRRGGFLRFQPLHAGRVRRRNGQMNQARDLLGGKGHGLRRIEEPEDEIVHDALRVPRLHDPEVVADRTPELAESRRKAVQEVVSAKRRPCGRDQAHVHLEERLRRFHLQRLHGFFVNRQFLLFLLFLRFRVEYLNGIGNGIRKTMAQNLLQGHSLFQQFDRMLDFILDVAERGTHDDLERRSFADFVDFRERPQDGFEGINTKFGVGPGSAARNRLFAQHMPQPLLRNC